MKKTVKKSTKKTAKKPAGVAKHSKRKVLASESAEQYGYKIVAKSTKPKFSSENINKMMAASNSN